jgi:FtsH-binding integral membrane protein
LKIISLFVAPIFIVFAQLITYLITIWFHLDTDRNISIPILFFVLALIELPLSLYGYELSPNATILERILVAASVGTVITLISQLIVKNEYIK